MSQFDIGTLPEHQVQGGTNMLLLLCVAAFGAALVFALVLNTWRQTLADERANRVSTSSSGSDTPFVTLLIPARNAASTLSVLLQDIHAQSHPLDRMEVLVIDDGSEDPTWDSVQGMMHNWPGLRVLNNDGVGKKAAIVVGVREAKGELIILTDADARCGPKRIQHIVHHWQEVNGDMILLPVRTESRGGFLGGLQEEEQSALLGVAAATAFGGSPMLANGANMAFTRSAFLSVRGFEGDRFASGDDIFLLDRMKRVGKNISYLLDREALVTVDAEPTLMDFWQQRLRWAGKMRGVRGAGNVLGACALLLPYFLLLTTGIFASHITAGQGLFRCLLLLGSAWLLWLVPVLALVQEVKRFLNAPFRAIATVVAFFSFSFYAPLVAVFSMFVRPKWKGRWV